MIDRYDEHLILAYVEGELQDPQRAQFEALLAHDEAMRHLVQQLIADRDLLRTLPNHDAPAELMAEIHDALERQMLLDAPGRSINVREDIRPYRFPVWARWGAAMAAMLALGAGLTWQFDPFGWFKTNAKNIGSLAINDANRDINNIHKGDPFEQGTVDIGKHGSENLKNRNDDAFGGAGAGSPAVVNADPLAKGRSDATAGTNPSTPGSAGTPGNAFAGAAPAAGGKSGGSPGSAATGSPFDESKGALALKNAGTSSRSKEGTLAADVVTNALKKADADAARVEAMRFELQLASGSAAPTRDLVLAWAKDHGATPMTATEAQMARRLAANASKATRSRTNEPKLAENGLRQGGAAGGDAADVADAKRVAADGDKPAAPTAAANVAATPAAKPQAAPVAAGKAGPTDKDGRGPETVAPPAPATAPPAAPAAPALIGGKDEKAAIAVAPR